MLLLFVIDALSLWLSVSVLLSWVTTSKYFFPVPSVPIRPAQLLTPKGGDAGALGESKSRRACANSAASRRDLCFLFPPLTHPSISTCLTAHISVHARPSQANTA